MKITRMTTSLLAAFAVLAAVQAYAPPPPGIVKPLNLTLTVMFQGYGLDDGTTTTITSPVVFRDTTKTMIQFLAADEYAGGYYPSNSFPAGSKLAIIDGTICVVNQTNGLVLDVSNIFWLEASTNGLFSGRVNNATGLASPTLADMSLVTFIYDNSSIPAAWPYQFTLKGIAKSKYTDGPLDAGTLTYSESASHTITGMMGEGWEEGDYFIITGSAKAAGKGVQNYDP
jgi:hypothetical protein